jgi:hypothetical protein
MSGKELEVLDFMPATAFDPLMISLLSTVMEVHEKRLHIVTFVRSMKIVFSYSLSLIVSDKFFVRAIHVRIRIPLWC